MLNRIFTYSYVVQVIGFLGLIVGYLFFSPYSPVTLAGFWMIFLNSFVLMIVSYKLKSKYKKNVFLSGFIISFLGFLITSIAIIIKFLSLS